MTAFGRLNPRLREAITSHLAWEGLRPVQDAAAEAILAGSNTLIVAPGGAGKTAAAFFPVLSTVLDADVQGVGVLYLGPARAWLDHLEARVGIYAGVVGLRRFVWHGAVDEASRQSFLMDPAEVLMITPESLEVMLFSRRVPTDRLFTELRAVIVDEAHALAGTDRGAHLLSVLERVVALAHRDVQRVGLSAPVGNPAEIVAWLQGSSERASEVVDPPRSKGRKALVAIARSDASALAVDAALLGVQRKSLVFCQSRVLTEVIADRMRVQGINVHVHHGSVPERTRERAEEDFVRGQNTALVATSALEKCVDAPDIDQVLQTNAPSAVATFLQRMGRTGRRANTAENTTFLCESPEAVLQVVAVVDLARRSWVETVRVNPRCWQGLVHQLMALAIERQGVTTAEAWAQLTIVPDFAGVRRAEFDVLIEHLVAKGYLTKGEKGLVLGGVGESEFGRRNFMEIYAGFTSPSLFSVSTVKAAEIGTVEQDFVDRLTAGVSVFHLAGRLWRVDGVRWRDRVVVVSPSPDGMRATWGGKIPQVLGRTLCRRMRAIVASDSTYPYLHPTARDALAALRAEHRLGATRTEPVTETGGELATWYTWAGGKINHALALALTVKAGWRVVPDNLRLRIEGGATLGRLYPLIEAMRAREFWEDPVFAAALHARLGAWRLRRFQDALPDAMARELVADYLLDVDAVVDFLQAPG